jgi:hypothetical protein
LFGNFFNLFLYGGECAEDIQKHFRPALEQIPDNAVASADTQLRCFNELATENTSVIASISGKEYQFNINVNRSRMDAGSYSENIIKAVAKYSRLFYIRANKCESLTEEIQQLTGWQTIEINFKEYQVASIPFTNFLAERNYRLVVMREKTGDQQLDLFEGRKFNYRRILTNDQQSTEKEVIEYYNQLI